MGLLAFLNDNFSKPDHSIWKGMWWDVVYTIIPDYRGEIIIPKIKKGAESHEGCRVNCTQILIERKTPQRSLKAPQCVNPELRVVQSNPALAARRLESLFTTEAQAQATPATEETQVEKRHQNNWQSGFYVSSSVGKMSTKAEQCEYDCVCVCVPVSISCPRECLKTGERGICLNQKERMLRGELSLVMKPRRSRGRLQHVPALSHCRGYRETTDHVPVSISRFWKIRWNRFSGQSSRLRLLWIFIFYELIDVAECVTSQGRVDWFFCNRTTWWHWADRYCGLITQSLEGWWWGPPPHPSTFAPICSRTGGTCRPPSLIIAHRALSRFDRGGNIERKGVKTLLSYGATSRALLLSFLNQ